MSFVRRSVLSLNPHAFTGFPPLCSPRVDKLPHFTPPIPLHVDLSFQRFFPQVVRFVDPLYRCGVLFFTRFCFFSQNQFLLKFVFPSHHPRLERDFSFAIF